MEINFTKMHGTGNDFIVIDCRERELSSAAEFAVKYCDRRFGVGADQVLILRPSETADFRMLIYNADGSEVEMCGNGIRCLARYIWDKGLSNKDILDIETLAGIIRPERDGELVRVDMGEPILDPGKVPVTVPGDLPLLDYPLNILGRDFSITCVSMGNPHAVIFLDEDVKLFPLEQYGKEIENHPIFPKRTNVEFVNVSSSEELTMRVWERGSGETWACGTGACAAGVAAMLKGLAGRMVVMRLKGGDLEIEWAANNHVYMTGPAVTVFEGTIKEDSEADRRRHRRRAYRNDFEVFLKGMSNQFYCNAVSVDISDVGIGLISEGVLEPGQVVLFRNKEKVSDLQVAVVKWSVREDGRYKAGLMFI